MMSERIAAMSDKVRNTQPTICLDRARLMTEFYSQPSMENYILRRAQAFQYFLENKKIFIDPDGEQLAGHLGSRWQAVPLHPDVTAWLYDDLKPWTPDLLIVWNFFLVKRMNCGRSLRFGKATPLEILPEHRQKI